METSVLYNCCTNYAAPDWSLFDAIEIGGCREVGGEDPEMEGYTEGGFDRSEADFFTVYGRLKAGGCEAITDCETLPQAQAIAGYLEIVSGGLPVQVFC